MRRSILITLDQDDGSVSSSIDFMRRLEELRLRYPSWSIRGIVHRDERLSFVPQKPTGITPPRAAQSPPVTALPTPHPSDDWAAASLGSDDSDGNVIGQPPRIIDIGLRVQLQEAPYQGRIGTVAEIQGERFRVEIPRDDGAGVSPGNGCFSWWCTSEDVVTLSSLAPSNFEATGATEQEVPLSTLQYIRVLEARIEELERTHT
ncbi:Hypothetical protein, putative [Bodo saltans]|uniref:Uncharacterized protein n=1 Tax=Bodo saltans TaxID=75058 RepID=A0A0S4KJM5_BODSA|nr:Hypothetical protein, putative [Bodo saltans]|eukprot:CUI15194.1 Hypothetical protein, putative [Bodo saltans]